MSKSRRQFLRHAGLAFAATAAACRNKRPAGNESSAGAGQPPPGAPPTFGNAPAFGPEVSAATFAEAEKLVNVQMTPNEREQAAGSWRKSLAPLYERRVGPRKVAIEPTVAPYSNWNPVLPGEKPGPAQDQFIPSRIDTGALPARDEDIAFAGVAQLAAWI